MTNTFQFTLSLILLILLSYNLNDIYAQNLRRNRKERPGRSVAGRDPSIKENMNEALTINFPLHFFENDNFENWRNPARYSKELVKSSESERLWSESSQGQDQEDVWLYENWFYGMEKGVIMESGALNGILFSNSIMFEQFANWTSINVEADPENYSNLKVNRQRAINVNGALCSEPRLLHYSSLGVVPVRGID
jgi:hypothetical protein